MAQGSHDLLKENLAQVSVSLSTADHHSAVDAASLKLQDTKTKDDALLAQLGYKSEFKRGFSLVETIAFAFSIMGVVASVSSSLEFPLVAGGHFGMVFGWLIPSLFVMTVALSMAELASSMPTSAGLYYFAAKSAPEKYSALFSWITAWANITGQISLVCSIDYTCAQMIATATYVGSDGSVKLPPSAIYGILVTLLLVHGVVCSAATRVLARLNVFYVFINLGTTFAAVVCLFLQSRRNQVTAGDAFLLFENNTGWSNNGWAFLLAFTAPMWTLTGYDSAVHIAEEVSGASVAAPIAILASVGGTASLGLLLMIAASFATVSVPALLASPLPMPMGQLFLDALGKKGMLVIWGFIICVQFFTGAAQGVDASRVVFAFARDNALPGSSIWKRMNSSTGTPVNSVWFVMGSSMLIGLLCFSEAAFASMAGASVIGLYTSYAIPIALRITCGRKQFIPGPFTLGRWATPIGMIATTWVSFTCVILIFPAGVKLTAATMNYSVVIIMGVFAFASASWVFSARRWFRGPVRTIDSLASSLSEVEVEKA